MFIKIKEPFTFQELKTAYRLAVKRWHLDCDGNSIDFCILQSEYKSLLLICKDSHKPNDHTVDGTLLSELGLGLETTKNGKQCDMCLGKGYRSYKTGGEFKPCPNTVHRERQRCALCLNKYPSNDYISFIFFRRRTEYRILTKRKTEHRRCSKCKGIGEVEVFNPAFPKGLTTESQNENN